MQRIMVAQDVDLIDMGKRDTDDVVDAMECGRQSGLAA